MNKFLSALQYLWTLLGLTLLLIVALDRGLGMLVKSSTGVRTKSWISEYGKPEWAGQYRKEFKRAHMDWEPFVYFRRRPLEGEFVNIDKDGRRKTWTSESTAESTKTYFFGGSTMWGTGSRDDFTIPSQVAKHLAGKGKPIEAFNYGESGFVSTQSLIQLLKLLQQGHRPNLVVFYDGFNDVASALQNEQAGWSMNEYKRQFEFNSMGKPQRDMPLFIRNTGLMRFVLQIKGEQELVGELKRPVADLAMETLNTYKVNVQAVLALANTYDFDARFFWQPVVHTKATPTPFEQKIRSDSEPFKALFNATYELIAADEDLGANPAFHNLSNVFTSEAGVYLDQCHLTEDGNRQVAEAITSVLLDAG